MDLEMFISRISPPMILLLLIGCSQPVAEPVTEPTAAPVAEVAEVAAPEPEPEPAEPTCAGGVAKDDGSVDAGYGFVPSAKWGLYLQEFHSDDFSSREMSEVCVCWLRNRLVESVEYDVVFFEDAGGKPADKPYASVRAWAHELPMKLVNAGRMYGVDVSGVTLAEGKSYIGVRFDPSAAEFIFVCSDKSPETEVVQAFQREDRAPGWQSLLTSKDPMFRNHKAMMIRAKAKAP